jgi:demethylmenaquinone methyltransferase/2-methoxy-6-polyprenyl-1,4-benzoquinol methylase
MPSAAFLKTNALDCARSFRMPVMPTKTDNPAWNDELLRDPHAVADKRRRVQNMFAAIAPSYDLNNRLHSLWMDQAWRRKAVKLAKLKSTDRVVDVACGTGDLTLTFLRKLNRLIAWDAFQSARKRGTLDGGIDLCASRQVFGIDFTYEMLPIARRKTPPGTEFVFADRGIGALESQGCAMHPEACKAIDEGRIYNGISWLNGDAQSLPMPECFADVVSIAFGIRNVQDPLAAMQEFRRVLRPGGRVIILEFSLPTNAILRGLYNFYFRQVLPRTATLISGDKTGAYKYLPQSVNTFIGREQMMAMMRTAGFAQVEQFPMTFGVCVCYRGVAAQ